MSASSVAANGAGPMPAISMMRNPASGPIVVTFPLRRVAPRHASVCVRGKRFSMTVWLHCATQASTINERASSVSPLRCPAGSPARLARMAAASPQAAPVLLPAPAPAVPRDLSTEFERFLHIGERLERGLEALKDIQWEIRENEARYRDLLDNQADVILRRDERRPPHLRQPGLLPGVRARAQRRAGPARSRRACSTATRRPRSLPARAAPAALRAADRDGARPALVRMGGACRAGGRRRRAGGAMPRPRHHRAAAHRGRAEGGAQAGGSGQPRQVALPGRHEPRDPHADERHPRHDRRCSATPSSSPEQRTYAHAIERSARTLLTLIDEILDFSKIEADKLQLNARAAGGRRVRAGRGRAAGAEGLREGHRHRLGGRSGAAAPLLGDEVRVRQIVTNLVGNAIKFTDSGGVLVTVGRAPTAPAPCGGSGRGRHRHRGRGHRHRHRARDAAVAVLEFEQAEAAVRRRQGGTGLGLAISRRLARAMGGRHRGGEHAGSWLDVHGHPAAQAAPEPAERDGSRRRAPSVGPARAAGARPRRSSAAPCACRSRVPASPWRRQRDRRGG